MKNQDQNNHQIGLQQVNSIFQVWRQLKNSIFNVLFVLLNQTDDGDDQSIIGLCIQTGIDYLQMMSFPFNSAIINVWNGGQTLSAFTSIFTNLSFSQFIPGVGFNTFLMMLYFLIFIIILVIVDIIYVSYSFSKKKFKFTWPLQFLAKVVPLCVTVFFLPIMETLLSVVSCQNSEQMPGVQVMQNFPDIVCWQGWHMFHAVVTLFFTSIFVFIASIVALTIFQPRMTTNRLTARQNSTGQVIFIINKMTCQFVFSFTPFDSTWVYCIMLFVLSGWLWTSYNVQQPFYNKNASKFFRICSTYYFWTNAMLIISQILLDFGFEGGLVIWMCGLPFIGISIVFERKSNIQKLFSSNLKFRSGEELQSHLQYVLQLIHNRDKDKNSYMLLLGYIQKHIQICMEEDCPLKVKKIKKQQDLPEIQQNCQQLIKQLLRMYKQGVKKYPTCTRLRLSFAFFYMQKLQSNNKAYQQFSIAQNTQPSFGQQFIIYRFKKIIRENLQQNNEQDDNDLIQIIRFDNHVSLCEQAMLLSARLHKDFWTQLQQQTPDLKKLNSIGSKITQTTITVKQNYKQIHKINNHVSQVIHNYAIYLIFIGQSHTQGKTLLQQAKRIYFEKKQKQQNDMGIFTLKNSQYGDLTCIQNSFSSMIKVSIEEQSVGKIIYANDAFTQLTGYIKQDITERTIDKILPSVYSFHHKNAIKMWINDQDKKVLANNNSYLVNPHNGYVRQKSGFLMPVNYRVSFNTQQNCFLAVMRSDPLAYTDFNCKIYIITNVNNGIRDISPLGYMYFRIGRQQCQGKIQIINSWIVLYLITGNPLGQQQIVTIFQNRQLILLMQVSNDNILGIQIQLRQTYSVKTLKSNTFTHKTLKNNTFNQQNLQNSQKQQTDQNIKKQIFNIRAQQIWINANQDLQEVFDDQSLYRDGKLKVGLIYILQKIKLDIHVNQNNQKNTQLNIFDDILYDMYKQQEKYLFPEYDDDPQEVNRQKKSKILAQMLIEMNNGQKITFQQKKFRNYAQQLKIKTYRYWNQDFIRIYGIQYQNQQNNQFQYENDELCNKNDIKRLQKKHYQDKIKQAINTSIQHEQIQCLRKYSLFFFFILCGLSSLSFALTLQELQKVQDFTGLNFIRSKDSQFITTIIQDSINLEGNSQNTSINNITGSNNSSLNTLNGTLNNNKSNYILINNNTQSFIKNYKLIFDPNYIIPCQLQNNRMQNKSLLQVMSIIQARVINYFSSQSVSKNIQIAYSNFILSIYPILQSLSIYETIQITYIILIAGLIIVNSLIMIIIWIYNIMRIDQKRFDIMIWFLDIPIDYVVYLENNCNRFIKNYIPIKELQQRGINMDDKEHYCDQFSQKKVQDDEQLDQENKARKIMIARHRKKTFMSRFNCSYLSTLWLLVYSSLVSMFFSIQISYQKTSFQFINKQWNLLNKQYIWSSTFPIVLSLQQLGYKQLTNSVSYRNLYEFEQQIRSNFLNTLTKHNKVNDIKQLIQKSSQISDIYSDAFYGDLCQFILKYIDTDANTTPDNNRYLVGQQCGKILNEKLRGGIRTYESYLVNYNKSQITNIIKAHYQVVGPSIMIILGKWKDYFINQAKTFKSYSNIIIYLYIVLSLIGYTSLWMIYLKNQNMKMNQTIQMLNMIPMNMLPKNRKDTRDFLNWLIQQANKKKQGQDQ